MGTEFKELLRLSLPIMLTQLAQMGLGVADTVMAGRYSARDLAGVALGGNLFWPVLLFLTGTLMAVTPSVAQLRGAGRQAESGEVVRQALWLALGGGLGLIVLLNLAGPIYRGIGVDPLAIPISVAYLQALSFGVLPLLGYFTLRYLCDGMSWTLPAMAIAVSALLLKIPLNYWFIYGGAGLPAMGGAGCGWASALVMWYELLAMVAVVRFSRVRNSGLFQQFSWPSLVGIGRLLRLGLPIGAAFFFEIGMFSCMTLLIGKLGVQAVAAHQIATSVGGLTFMVPMALGMAAYIRVGFHVGAGDLPAARRSGGLTLLLSLAFALAAAVVLFGTREAVAGLYTTQAPVQALAAQLILFVVFYQLFDDTQVAAIGALRGYKDTRVPMWITLVSYWFLGLPVGVLLGFGLLGLPDYGVQGFWTGLVVGLLAAAVGLLLRWRQIAFAPAAVQAAGA